jgi:hypothetical protein
MIPHCKLALTCALTCALFSSFAQTRMKAESGFIDAREWDYSNERIALAGYWKFYSKALVASAAEEESEDINNGDDYLFPAVWNDVRTDGSGKGFGTYSLRIVLPEKVDALSLEIPQLYSSYTLYVDGEIVAQAGKVGATAEETTPYWVHQTATFSTVGKDTIHLLLQVANFHHAKGGISDHIYMATPELISAHYNSEKFTSTAEAILLCALGIGFLILYIKNPKPVTLSFALFCLTWSVRSVFSNIYLIVNWFPDIPWGLLVRTEYFTLYFGMIWSSLFLYFLFKNIGSNQVLTYILVFLNVMFGVFTLFASPAVFTKSVSLYLMVAAVTVIYGGAMVIRALFVEHAGAGFLMASILIGAILFGYDIITYQTTVSYNFIFLSIGYMVMFVLVALGLLFHLNIFKGKKNSNMLTYEDMFRQ